MARIIDAHQHLWEPRVRSYAWIDDPSERGGPFDRDFTVEEIEPQMRSAGVDATVLVQSANTYDDTFSMLAVSDRVDFVDGVVGWVALDRHDEMHTALNLLVTHPRFVGVRHLIHTEPDPDWVVRPEILDGLRILAERDLTFDVVSVLPRHLEHVPTIAAAVPELKLVIDHLSKPPIAERGWQPWADLFAAAAEHPNVFAKVSGLNTAANHDTWTAADLQPYVDTAVDLFTPARLMFGGDWPISTIAGGYQKWFDETLVTLTGLTETERDDVMGATAVRFYGLG